MNRLLPLAFLIVASAHASSQQGYVSGTVAAVAASGRGTPCGNLTLIVSRLGRELSIRADENGDYAPRLDIGEYALQRVLDEKHRELRIRQGQARDFVVTEGEVTRFDVLVEIPCPSEENSPTNESDDFTSHISFSLVRGSAGFTSPEPGGMMTDAPYTVLAFTEAGGNKHLVMTDAAGDYTAVLQPGHYCVSAYNVKTGDRIPLDPRQLKCVDVLVGKDVRLDIMLAKARRAGADPGP